MSTPDPATPEAAAETAIAPQVRSAREELLAHPANWSWWEAIAAFIVTAVIGVFVSGAVALLLPPEDGATILVISIVLDGTILGGLLLWLRLAHRGWGPAINVWPAHPLEEMWAGIVRGFVVYLLAALVVALPLMTLLELIYGAPAQTPQQLPDGTTSGARAILAVVFAALVAPTVEEFFFRGVFFRAVRARTGFWPSALATGLLFGSIHFDPEVPIQNSLLLVLIMVFVGMSFAFIYERRGTLLAPIAAHITFNIIGLAFILSQS